MDSLTDFNSALDMAVADGLLLPEARTLLERWYSSASLPDWVRQSLDELIDEGQWEELNDRFFREIAFGTGGMRGRTIGRVVTKAERGSAQPEATPQRPAAGANVLNDFTVIRATIGLYRYTCGWLQKENPYQTPRLVIAHDVRHFSKHFSQLAASVWMRLGGEAFVFDGPRSTPQLSFAVRHLRATAGIVITASHNPPNDNGYKVYFEDGAQIVSPHAEGIVHEVSEVALEETIPYLQYDSSALRVLGADVDEAYQAVVLEQILSPEVIKENRPRVVFTPIHGTGGVSTLPILHQLGVDVVPVDAQWQMDPAFSTVQSPNPENAEALKQAIAVAESSGAGLVLATDPDCDRMGVAVRDANGAMQLLSGNMIGSLLADFRIRQMKRLGWLPEEGHSSAVLIKTFVTTPMQEAIARKHGVRCVNTLTGFKWIGEKLEGYQQQLLEKYFQATGLQLDPERSTAAALAALQLKYGNLYLFGGEESYGYLASDRVRDKDGNAAVALFCELYAALAAEGKSILERVDELYLEYGYFEESLVNIYYEGASGARKIQSIIASYMSDPPARIGELAVTRRIDFWNDTIVDEDGKKIAPEKFFFFELENGYRFAVRGSGTEPKMKFYLFAEETVHAATELPSLKVEVEKRLQALGEAVQNDARSRAGD